MKTSAYDGVHANHSDEGPYPGIPSPAEILQWIEEGGSGHTRAQGYPKPEMLRRAYQDLTDPPKTHHRWCPQYDSMFCAICQVEEKVTRAQKKEFQANWRDDDPITDWSWRDHPGPHRCAQVHLLKPRKYTEPQGLWPFKKTKELPEEVHCGDDRPLEEYEHRGIWIHPNNYRQKYQPYIYELPWEGYPITTVNCAKCLTLAHMTQFLDPETMSSEELAKAAQDAAECNSPLRELLPIGQPRRSGPGPERYMDHA